MTTNYDLCTRRARLGIGLWIIVSIAMAGNAFAADSDEPLRPGDKLHLVLPSVRTPTVTYEIDTKGVLKMGYYGKLNLKDKTLNEATSLIRAHMSKYVKNADSIKVLLDRPKRAVAVTGQVVEPGIVSVYENVDIWGAIQRAGGIADSGDVSGVTLIRNGDEIPVDLAAYLTGESEVGLPELKTGDTIFVPVDPARSSEEKGVTAFLGSRALMRKIFVVGAVESPGVFDRVDEVDLWAAIGLAKGPKADADLAHVRVISEGLSSDVNLLEEQDAAAKTRYPYSDSATIIYVPPRVDNADTGTGAHINVIGSVERPGRYAVSNQIKLVDVLSIAGGPTERGRLSRVRVVEDRAGYTLAQTFDLGDYVKTGGMLGRVTVKPGSTVFVARSIGAAMELPLRVLTDLAIIGSTVALWFTIVD